MLQKIAIFILFLGPLVFFHELGHFLFARFFGVRVEVFSIGFGPKLFKFKKGFTEYAFSLIPLGGYVKMYGDDPFNKDGVPESQKKYSFIHKNKWQRFWIVFGGPLANFILAYAIFFSLFMTGEKVPEIKIGSVKETSKFYSSGFRSGDVIKKINGNVITSPSDIILEGGDKIRSIEVERLGFPKTLNIDFNTEEFFKEMSKYPPALVLPIVKSMKGEIWAISKSSKEVDWTIALDEMALGNTNGELYLHKITKLPKGSGIPELDKKVSPVLTSINGTEGAFFKSLRNQALYPMDIVVKSVNMNSPADKAGLVQGDIIFNVNGKDVSNFESLKSSIQDLSKDSSTIQIVREGKILTVDVTPEEKVINGNKVRLIGVYGSGLYARGQYVEIAPLSIGKAITKSFSRTVGSITKTVEGFKKLITAEVSFQNIGGPLAIGKVASDSFNTSLSYFFQLMALISVNLGIINLFPIPVLDGGHIMFIILETLNGGPLSRRKLEIAQQFGLSLLLLLMVGALFNDFTRFF